MANYTLSKKPSGERDLYDDLSTDIGEGPITYNQLQDLLERSAGRLNIVDVRGDLFLLDYFQYTYSASSLRKHKINHNFLGNRVKKWVVVK